MTPGDSLAALAAAAMRDTPWLHPALSIAHIAGFVTLVGSVAVFDLRVLGLTPSISVRALARHALPWSWASLLVIFPTGLFLFAARVEDYLGDRVFQLKMGLLLAAAINTAFFLTGPYQTVAAWDANSKAPFAARASAAASLAIWLAVLACGRLLAPFQ